MVPPIKIASCCMAVARIEEYCYRHLQESDGWVSKSWERCISMWNSHRSIAGYDWGSPSWRNGNHRMWGMWSHQTELGTCRKLRQKSFQRRTEPSPLLPPIWLCLKLGSLWMPQFIHVRWESAKKTCEKAWFRLNTSGFPCWRLAGTAWMGSWHVMLSCWVEAPSSFKEPSDVARSEMNKQ